MYPLKSAAQKQTFVLFLTQSYNVPAEKRSTKTNICPFFDTELETLNCRRTERFYKKNPTSEKKLAYQQAILKYKEAFKRKKSMYFDRNVNKNINLRVKFANSNRLLGVPTEHMVPRNWRSVKMSADRFQKFFRDKVLDISELIPTSTDNGLNSLFLVDEFNHVTMSLDKFNSVELKNV